MPIIPKHARPLLLSAGIGLAACQNFTATHDKTRPSVDGPAILAPAPLAQDVTDNSPQAAQFTALKWDAEAQFEYQRNAVVGAYLAQSDLLCGEYLQHLTRFQRGYSLLLGSLGTVLGGAGAAFTGASAARPLSALAGIASGERAEFDADTFVKQTSQVIISAIKNSRARTYNTIVQVNFLKPVSQWPLSVALADVQDYHARCSLNEGISEAAASVTSVAPQSTPVAATSTGVAGRSEAPLVPQTAPPTGAADPPPAKAPHPKA